MSRRRGRVFSYLAAYMLGLVCHVGDSGVSWSFQDTLAQPHPQGASLFQKLLLVFYYEKNIFESFVLNFDFRINCIFLNLFCSDSLYQVGTGRNR